MIKKLQLMTVSVMLCGGLSTSVSLFAKEFQSIKSTAVLYDAPAVSAKKVAIAPTAMPVQVLVKLDNGFVKIQDSEGANLWVEKKYLSPTRTFIFTKKSSLREMPDATAKAVLTAQPGVVVEGLSLPQQGWVKVKHRQGSVGFVSVADVWGE